MSETRREGLPAENSSHRRAEPCRPAAHSPKAPRPLKRFGLKRLLGPRLAGIDRSRPLPLPRPLAPPPGADRKRSQQGVTLPSKASAALAALESLFDKCRPPRQLGHDLARFGVAGNAANNSSRFDVRPPRRRCRHARTSPGVKSYNSTAPNAPVARQREQRTRPNRSGEQTISLDGEPGKIQIERPERCLIGRCRNDSPRFRFHVVDGLDASR